LDTSQTKTSGHSGPQGQWCQAGVISVQGATAADFLQGYVTCDTRRLQPGQGLPMAICNLKGRVVASGWLITSEEGIDVLVHASLADDVRTFLKPYVSFSKCTFASGPDKSVVVNTADADIQLTPDLSLKLGDPGKDLEDCSEGVNTCLINAGYAFVSKPVSGQFLPQVLDLHNQGAVDFDKGCYLGQEIVARAQFRGAVKRHLISFNAATLPCIGDTWGESGTVIAVDSQGRGLASAKVDANSTE
jgi:tRNA-modifying protein YgfZ